jgi:hypothetical protein
MNPAGGKTKKKVGAKMKADDDVDDPKKLANRLRQRKFREKTGKQIGGVVDDLDKCDEERAELKQDKAQLEDKVASLTGLLKNCDDQVADILKSVKTMKMGAKAKSPNPQGGMTKGGNKSKASSPAPTAVEGKEASKIIQGAMRGKIARKKMAEAEKQRTFDILLR